MERVTVWDCSCTSSSACLTVTGLHVLPDSNGCLFGSEECSLTEGVCWGNPNLTQPPEQSVCFFFICILFYFLMHGFAQVSPAALLSSMNTEAVCERLKLMDGIDSTMLHQYISTIRRVCLLFCLLLSFVICLNALYKRS